ncbi:MAG: hypothetical protein JWP94_3040 [Mucilaginibacter sp.]|nr:hypothetical protein [Mucilaginibacter sp.]
MMADAETVTQDATCRSGLAGVSLRLLGISERKSQDARDKSKKQEIRAKKQDQKSQKKEQETRIIVTGIAYCQNNDSVPGVFTCIHLYRVVHQYQVTTFSVPLSKIGTLEI